MKQGPLSLEKFQERFSTDKTCMEHLFKLRWPDGYTCPRCGRDWYYFHSSRNLYECKSCRYQVSLTAGSIFHRTKTPLRKWFLMIFLMARPKCGISMLSFQRMLNINDYKTVWMMGHKIRRSMANQDADYNLAGLFNEDQVFDRILSSCLNTPAITFSDLKA